MLRSKFHIFGIDSTKTNWSISGTAQENLIIILVVAEMWTLPEEDLGRLDSFRKVVYSGAWNMYQARKKIYDIFDEINENDIYYQAFFQQHFF